MSDGQPQGVGVIVQEAKRASQGLGHLRALDAVRMVVVGSGFDDVWVVRRVIRNSIVAKSRAVTRPVRSSHAYQERSRHQHLGRFHVQPDTR